MTKEDLINELTIIVCRLRRENRKLRLQLENDSKPTQSEEIVSNNKGVELDAQYCISYPNGKAVLFLDIYVAAEYLCKAVFGNMEHISETMNQLKKSEEGIVNYHGFILQVVLIES